MSGSNTDSRYVIDRALLERLVGSEREFREEVLVSLAELKVSMKTMQTSFDAHVQEDADKFSKVNLSIGENTGNLKTIAGGFAAAIFLISTGIALAKVLL